MQTATKKQANNLDCPSCGQQITARSSVYLSLCKPCGTKRWSEIVKASVSRRIQRAVGQLCRSCEQVTLTDDNQSRSYPGVCKSCYVKKHTSASRQSKDSRLEKCLQKPCKQCSAPLTEANRSLGRVGYCKGCATDKTKLHREAKLISVLTAASTICTDCSTSLTASNISLSALNICKTCRSKRVTAYYKQTPAKYLGVGCRSCQDPLTPQNQAKSSPKLCRKCANTERHDAFTEAIGQACISCQTTLTEDNQSRAHIKKCKSCRNAELKCTNCGNKGGVYRGKLCSTCAKK